MITIAQLNSDEDWKCAFADEGNYSEGNCTKDIQAFNCDDSPFSRSDVIEILAAEDGENDGPDWVGVFRLRDGRYASVSAGCDYTGWD
jgi:hypothetical protein